MRRPSERRLAGRLARRLARIAESYKSFGGSVAVASRSPLTGVPKNAPDHMLTTYVPTVVPTVVTPMMAPAPMVVASPMMAPAVVASPMMATPVIATPVVSRPMYYGTAISTPYGIRYI
ncbi:hypothetical protein GCK72_000389 [Caenorhabditis remanei]|uniref:Uncharacterized protein n=1 Tax=Caenorhabditis remanei TaxID=31234 RepID=A0A6A5HQJ1_CAERE|nr:hypothetical protein GCK72_000389 [Caenorhabditis remanei]KAF1768577.1 hypothetical protein GCK72_000389 [Caenorhabditis remanei]